MKLLVCMTMLHAAVGVAVYQDPTQPIPLRVQDLLSKMTVEEKIAQLFATHTGEQTVRQFINTSVGAAKFMSAFSCSTKKMEECVNARNKLQSDFLEKSRLKIPISFINEGLHGGAAGGTIFPMPVNQGCSWNPDLVNRIAKVIATEAQALGVDYVFSPVVNMMIDPRFGRLQEGFSENPTITAHMARASTSGLQGGELNKAPLNSDDYLPQNATRPVVISLAKHFGAYGAAMGGLNGGPADISNRTLFEVFLRPWRALGKAGARATMPSHNSIMGVPAHGDGWTINDLYRSQYGFGDGVTLSDCNDIGVLYDFRLAANRTHAAALGLKAGVDWDLQCGTDESQWSYNKLSAALTEGLVTEGDIDISVRHVLTQKFAARLFDKSPTVPTAPLKDLDAPKRRELALEAAEQGMVLLINRNNTLPLPMFSEGATSKLNVALIGPAAVSTAGADAISSLIGPYSLAGANVTTMDKALTAAGVAWEWEAGCEAAGPAGSGSEKIPAAVALANKSTTDVALLILGDIGHSCGEWGDRDSLDLPGGQLQLLQAVAGVAPVTVVVLIHGRQVTFGPANAVLDKVDALIAGWRPGEEAGTAIVNIIGGKTNPSAKLAQSWPRTVGHVGSGSCPWLQTVRGKWISNSRGNVDKDGRRYDNYISSDFKDFTPLFYFGYGLSFTTFSYANLRVTPLPLSPAGGSSSGSNANLVEMRGADNTAVWNVSVEVKNEGKMAGTEVVQVYVQDPAGLPFVPFWKRLLGFGRITLEAGATSVCIIQVEWQDLAMHDPNMELQVFEGKYDVSVGGASNTDALVATVGVHS